MIQSTAIVMAAVVVAIGLSACSPTQQAVLQAPAMWNTVTNPNVPVQDKACAVIDWGVPIGIERANESTLTVKQRYYIQAAADVGKAYCAGRDLRWQDRAVAAADTLSKVLWDVIK